MCPMSEIGTFNGLFALEAVTTIFRCGWQIALEGRFFLYFFIDVMFLGRAYDFTHVN